MASLSIVVPAYNEEDQIEALLSSLFFAQVEIPKHTAMESVELIVVNDGSTDRTAERLDQACRHSKGNVRIITHEINRGYGAALKSGLTAATGDLLSFMDADGTIDPLCFVELIQTMNDKRADMAVGTRFGKGASGMPILRKLGNHFFALLLSFLSGERVRDTASGVRLFRREVLPQLLPLPDGLHFTPAMSTKAVHEKLKVAEIRIAYSERGGASKLHVVYDGLRFLRIIVMTVLLYNPFKVFLLVGLLFEIFAAGLMSIPIYGFLSGERPAFSDYIYRSIGALHFFTAGVQIVLFGILARFIVSTFFRQHERGKILHRINDVVKIYDRMGWYGLSVFSVGVGINAVYFWKFIVKSGIDKLHWAWLLLASGFVIVGLQMIITAIVIRILKDIRAARAVSV